MYPVFCPAASIKTITKHAKLFMWWRWEVPNAKICFSREILMVFSELRCLGWAGLRLSRSSCMGRVFCPLLLQCWFQACTGLSPGVRRATFLFPSCEVFGSCRAPQIGNHCSWGQTHPHFVSKPHFSLCTVIHDQTQQLLPPFRNQSVAFLVIGTQLSWFEALLQHLFTICRFVCLFLIRGMNHICIWGRIVKKSMSLMRISKTLKPFLFF